MKVNYLAYTIGRNVSDSAITWLSSVNEMYAEQWRDTSSVRTLFIEVQAFCTALPSLFHNPSSVAPGFGPT